MEQVSRHFSRSFHAASVFCSSLEHAMPRASAPFSAEYSPLISVAYTWIHKDRETHQLATDIKRRDDGSQKPPKADERASAHRAGADARAAWRRLRPTLDRAGTVARPASCTGDLRGTDERAPHAALLTSQENAS